MRKIYQATKDTDSKKTCHKLVDGKKNTILLAKSEGNRRFGGFLNLEWNQNEKYFDDKSFFLFSLDKEKIYSYKKNGKAFWSNSSYIILGN